MKRLTSTFTFLVYLFLYLPIIVIVIFSFSQSEVLALPIRGWTLDWYKQALADDGLRMGLMNSLKVAFAATFAASLLGTMGAFAAARHQFFGKGAFRAAVIMPLVLPGILTGVAMLGFFAKAHVPLGLLTVAIGHATFGFPLVFNTMSARLARLPKNLEEAAADLGASPFQAFRRVIFQSVRSALAAGALLAFTLSFDEIIVTIFLTGQQNTLPMEIWARLRFGMTPEINATVSLILLASVVLVLFSRRLAKE